MCCTAFVLASCAESLEYFSDRKKKDCRGFSGGGGGWSREWISEQPPHGALRGTSNKGEGSVK